MVAAEAAQGRQRLGDGGVAMSGGGRHGGEGVAAVVTSAAAAAVATAVGLLPRPSVSSHLRWRRLPSFSQMTARVCGGIPSPLIEPKMGREGKGPT